MFNGDTVLYVLINIEIVFKNIIFRYYFDKNIWDLCGDDVFNRWGVCGVIDG